MPQEALEGGAVDLHPGALGRHLGVCVPLRPVTHAADPTPALAAGAARAERILGSTPVGAHLALRSTLLLRQLRDRALDARHVGGLLRMGRARCESRKHEQRQWNDATHTPQDRLATPRAERTA